MLDDIARNPETILIMMAGREGLESLAEEIEALGSRALPIYADVNKAEEVQSMIDRAVKEFGHIDILVDDASVASMAKMVDLSEEA